MDLSALTPGTQIRIRGHQEGEGPIQAQLIEVGGEGQERDELEFEGEVIAMTDGTLTVSTEAGNVVVNVDDDTEVDGQIEVGDSVKVHGAEEADGTVTARELDEIAGQGEGGGDSGSGGGGGGGEDDDD